MISFSKRKVNRMALEDKMKAAMESSNIIIGSRSVIKALKLKNLKSVILANNCPDNIKKDISHYAKISDIEIEQFKGTGKQLGIFCGKPFGIAVLGITAKTAKKAK